MAAIAATGGPSGSAATQPVSLARMISASHLAGPLQASTGQVSPAQVSTANAAVAARVTAAYSATTPTGQAAAAATGHRLGPTREIAWQMMYTRFGWRPKYQFRYLNWLWDRESSWNVYASNPYSGAYGIPQAVPGSKMASAGPNWRSSARTQIRWGLRYIRSRYGKPSRAWAHESAYGWY